MLQFLIFLITISLKYDDIFCYNLTNNYHSLSSDFLTSRQHRLISFKTDGDITLDLDFNVPFITLPIQSSMNLAKNSLINFNVGAIVVAGVILFGTAIILPILLTLFNKKGLIPTANPFNRFHSTFGHHQRSDDGLWKYIAALDTTLLKNDIDFITCSQRLTCWVVQKSSENVAKGNGSSFEKIFDGLISNKLFQETVLNSKLIEAVKYGLKKENSCSLVYKNCKFSYKSMYYLLKPFF